MTELERLELAFLRARDKQQMENTQNNTTEGVIIYKTLSLICDEITKLNVSLFKENIQN